MKDGQGDAGVRFGVVSFGAKGSIRDVSTLHLSLSLQPVVHDEAGAARAAEVKSHVTNEPE